MGDTPIPSKQIKGYEDQLAGRLNRLQLDFGGGVSVTIQSLSYAVYAAIEAAEKDEAKAGLMKCRVSIVAVEGMGDVPFETVKIGGNEFTCPTREWLESQILGFVNTVSINANRLNVFGFGESQAIDFT